MGRGKGGGGEEGGGRGGGGGLYWERERMIYWDHTIPGLWLQETASSGNKVRVSERHRGLCLHTGYNLHNISTTAI